VPANVETMFSVREVPWHKLGVIIQEAPSSEEALKLAGLDWTVYQQSISTGYQVIPGYKANIRSIDDKVLGVVTDRYTVVQNTDAFSFVDMLLGDGVKFETAGSLQSGKKVWLLARLPEDYIVNGDPVSPYLVFSSSHDGSGSIRVALSPIRVCCQNTLNLALSEAQRTWTTIHVGDMKDKLEEARKTLLLSEHYMKMLQTTASIMATKSLSDKKVLEFINELLPIPENAGPVQANNIDLVRTDIKLRYHEAPDLQDTPKNQWRLINAVSDTATHMKPLRRTETFQENMFSKVVNEGSPLIDRAYELLRAM
jgi:phage/plasmid-like protein (TIGR03299 family)